MKVTQSRLEWLVPASRLLIFPVVGQAANVIVIRTKKARMVFYISIIINERKKFCVCS